LLPRIAVTAASIVRDSVAAKSAAAVVPSETSRLTSTSSWHDALKEAESMAALVIVADSGESSAPSSAEL
jgi:hypothetical protein